MQNDYKYKAEFYPKISVITVVFNRVGTIERAIKSLLEQNYPKLEYIVLDGGSTDGTVEIINKYKDQVSHFRSHPDEGITSSINEGLRVATGDIIGLLHSDDTYEPGILLKAAETFINNPEIEMVNFPSRVVEVNAGQLKILEIFDAEKITLNQERIAKPVPNARFYKKHLFQIYGDYIDKINGEKTSYSDFEHILRLSINNVKNLTLNYMGYNYFSHEESLTFSQKSNDKYQQLKLWNEIAFYIELAQSKYGKLICGNINKDIKKSYRKSLIRKSVKNYIDKDYKNLKKTIKVGIKNFGPVFFLNFLRYLVKYKLQ